MQDRVKGPAIGLIVVAALGILMSLASLAMQGSLLEMYRSMGIPEDQLHQMESMMAATGLIKILSTLLQLAGSGFVIYAALQMMKLRGWTLAMIASIVAMIPCFTNCCCLVGLPIGIWSLVVLFKPDVKAAFTK